MFCPLPDDETKIVIKKLPSKKNHRSKKKHKQGKGIKKNTKLVSSMSSWAENFNFASTWQLKQQVAYWKARAKSLEYENSVLHDVIRKSQSVVPTNSSTDNESIYNKEMDESQTENEMNKDDRGGEGEDFEVSEEFIQFLTANAKYREEARRERDRLRKNVEETDSTPILKEESQETSETHMNRMKALYGDKWQTISALEMSMLSSFIHEVDLHKPSFWPNIPFNFNES